MFGKTQAVSRVARDKGSDPGAGAGQGGGEGASQPWWCDPAQPGYGFYVFKGIKVLCKEGEGGEGE